MEEYDDLVTASNIFTNVKEKYLFFFSKSGFTNPVIERAKNEGSTLLTLKDLYEIKKEGIALCNALFYA